MNNQVHPVKGHASLERVAHAALRLHTSRFDPYERAILGWLLSSCVIVEGAPVWSGRLRDIVDGARVSRSKLCLVLDAMQAGVCERTKVEGGTRVVVDLDAVEAHLGEPPPVVMCQACGARADVHTRDDGRPQDGRSPSTTGTMVVHDVDHLVCASVTISPSGTSYPQGGGDAGASARDGTTPPPPPAPEAVQADQSPGWAQAGIPSGIAPADLQAAVRQWGTITRATIVKDRDVNAIARAIGAHGVELVQTAMALLSDYSRRSRKPALLTYLPDRIEQVKASRAPAKGAAEVDYGPAQDWSGALGVDYGPPTTGGGW